MVVELRPPLCDDIRHPSATQFLFLLNRTASKLASTIARMAYGRGKKRSASTDAEDDVASKKSKFTPSTALKDDDAGNSYWEVCAPFLCFYASLTHHCV